MPGGSVDVIIAFGVLRVRVLVRVCVVVAAIVAAVAIALVELRLSGPEGVMAQRYRSRSWRDRVLLLTLQRSMDR